MPTQPDIGTPQFVSPLAPPVSRELHRKRKGPIGRAAQTGRDELRASERGGANAQSCYKDEAHQAAVWPGTCIVAVVVVCRRGLRGVAAATFTGGRGESAPRSTMR